MSCRRPDAIAPEALLAYLDGAAGPDVAQHVADCADCAAESQGLARAQRRLGELLDRAACPSAHEIGEYALDLLGPEQRVGVASHLLDCRRCAEELRTLRGFLAAEPATVQAPFERLRRVVASLLTTPRQAALAGLRGTADDASRAYRAGSVTITVSAAPATDGHSLVLDGLVVDDAADPTGSLAGEVRCLGTDGHSLVAPIDELGNFSLEGLTTGHYRLDIDLGAQIVEIVDLLLEP